MQVGDVRAVRGVSKDRLQTAGHTRDGEVYDRDVRDLSKVSKKTDN